MPNKVTKKQKRINALSEAQALTFAPLTFQALATMLELGILRFLDKQEATIEEIMAHLTLNEYTVKTLIQIGEVSNILQKQEEKYSLTAKGEAFLYDEMTIANFNFIKDICYLGASELTTSFLKEKPVGLQKFIEDNDTIYPLLPKLEEPLKSSWYNFDNLYSDNCFNKVFEIISSKYNKIFDIGGNTGKFERICLKNKNIDISMLDLPENISARLNEQELQGCKFIPINVLDKNTKYPNMADSAILMSQFLDCFSKEQILKILTDLRHNINENSSIFILEPFTDNQIFEAAKYSLTHISLYFTCMANGVSKMYEQKEFTDIINKSGLKLTNIYNNIGPFDYTLLECKKNGMV